MADEREWPTKVAGVTKRNPDGTDRQRILADSRPDDLVLFNPEPDNPHDPNAVAVHRMRKGWFGRWKPVQLGYLRRELAAEVAPKIERGFGYIAQITKITGGTTDAPTRGCNIRVREIPPESER